MLQVLCHASSVLKWRTLQKLLTRNVLQIPVAVGVTGYEAFSLYTGRRVIASKGDEGANFKVLQLFLYCFFGVLAGVVGGLLGLGGGFILGPLFLELGIPPQVSSLCSSITFQTNKF